MTYRMFRGLSVLASEVDEVVAEIQVNGLRPGTGMGRPVNHARAAQSLQTLRQMTALTRDLTRPDGATEPAVYATGDLAGALHYANARGRCPPDRRAITIEFEAPAEDCLVDGKDFLFHVFSHGDYVRRNAVVSQSFGAAALSYAERAWQERGMTAIALCDLATQDPEVVKAHHANALVLGGRSDVIFRSAFSVTAPISASAIAAVRIHDEPYTAPVPDVWYHWFR